jgi:hypothetical protein
MSEAESLSVWNEQYKDMKVPPQNIKSARIVEEEGLPHAETALDRSSIEATMRRVRSQRQEALEDEDTARVAKLDETLTRLEKRLSDMGEAKFTQTNTGL